MKEIYGILIEGRLIKQSKSRDYTDGYWDALALEEKK